MAKKKKAAVSMKKPAKKKAAKKPAKKAAKKKAPTMMAKVGAAVTHAAEVVVADAKLVAEKVGLKKKKK